MKPWGYTLLAAAGIVAVAFAGDAGESDGTNTVVDVTQRIPALSTQPPHEQRGYFPQGARLVVIGPTTSELVRVRFRRSDGRFLEALCHRADLGLAPPALPGPAPAPSARKASTAIPTGADWARYKSRKWLEDWDGHKEALELQRKHKVPLLIHFYTDWSEDCEVIWKELLNDMKFKNLAKHIIKLRINQEHGKQEGKLARRYRLRKYPTSLVIDKPRGEPRKVALSRWSFGRLSVLKPDQAVTAIMVDVEAEKARLAEEKARAEEAARAAAEKAAAGKDESAEEDDGLIHFD